MAGRFAFVVALLALFALAGCGRQEPSVRVATWTLEAAGSTTQVTLPAHVGDRLDPAPSRYTLRARVALPPALRDRQLTFSIVDLPAIAHLYAGGREASPLDVNTFDRYRSAGSHRWRVAREETRAPEIDLALVVDHRWKQSAWLDGVPELSDTPAGEPWFVFMLGWNRATGILGLTMTLLISTTYGLMFVADRRRSVHAWHAAQGIFGAAYPCLSLGILQPLLGTGEIAGSAVLITLSAISSVYFVAGMFEQKAPSPWWWGFAALTIGAALVNRGEPSGAGLVVPAVVLAVLAATVIGIRALFTARETGSPSLLATLAALGFPITALLGIPDILALLGLGDPFDGLRGGSLALAAVSLLQAGALSRSHVASLNRADDLNAQLAARVDALEATNREIGVLNDELRRQIAARSQKLEATLARLGPMAPGPRLLATGDVIDERYRVVRRIGEGGMGTVYEVERLVDGRRLALKVLSAARSGAELARLAREAELAAQLDHPNVVAIVDVDVSASGAVFLVMELVTGESLDDLQARYGDAQWARAILRQVASGLAAMHARGIVHRDLKPGNVLVTRGDAAKIADFGIATRTASGDDETIDMALTRTGQVLGTPLYMAPELARGARHATAASDVYALGVMGFELFTGELPAGFDSLSHLRARGEQPTPSFLGIAGIDPRVARLLSRALAREPAQRPTAREIEAALAAPDKAPRDVATA